LCQSSHFWCTQDRKQRAIAVEERKLSKELKQREAEFHNTLKQKDKQIKVRAECNFNSKWVGTKSNALS
jgi:hypothetical protein